MGGTGFMQACAPHYNLAGAIKMRCLEQHLHKKGIIAKFAVQESTHSNKRTR